MDDAIELGAMLTDGLIRNREEMKKKDNTHQNKNEQKRSESNFSHKDTRSPAPECRLCKRRHFGKCGARPFCNTCKTPGHSTENCYKNRKLIVCYGYGESGHIKPQCPKAKEAGTLGTKSAEGVKKNDRAFVLNANEAAKMPDVITGTFLVDNIYAKVLFDSGANQSFIDIKLYKLLDKPLSRLDKSYEVETANGDVVKISSSLNDCKISIYEHVLHVQLLSMTLAGFDIVLGMDWLSANQAQINGDKKSIEIHVPDSKIITIK
ncbi:hypothetical protein L1987_17937 [Smallanthus sonchifolius]|uniref:Uncharacterized protein n=1 Tax=Smallanthus sonchifolius TaxID=185202 RepID=A0ACB9IYC2_9ASTR|nr:hypothetical protein L1987_17937 [Smallanthus sonchifolius]